MFESAITPSRAAAGRAVSWPALTAAGSGLPIFYGWQEDSCRKRLSCCCDSGLDLMACAAHFRLYLHHSFQCTCSTAPWQAEPTIKNVCFMANDLHRRKLPKHRLWSLPGLGERLMMDTSHDIEWDLRGTTPDGIAIIDSCSHDSDLWESDVGSRQLVDSAPHKHAIFLGEWTCIKLQIQK